MNKIKFLLLSIAAILLTAYCASPLDVANLMNDFDINQVNQQQLVNNQSLGVSFKIRSANSIMKDLSVLSSSATTVDTDGSVPIIIHFTNGLVSAASVVIYEINVTGDRGTPVNITKSYLLDTGNNSSQMWIYTDNLGANTTYEIAVTASGTHNNVNSYLDTDGDGVEGEAQDDYICRFSTGAAVITLKLPQPRAVISLPSASAMIYGGTILKDTLNQYVMTNTILDTTNGANIDAASVIAAFTLYSLNENKSYPLTVTYASGDLTLNTIVRLPADLPIGVYKLIRTANNVKEVAPIYGYTHYGILDNNTAAGRSTYTFQLITGNPIPTYTSAGNGEQILLTFDEDIDTSTINQNTVFAAYDDNPIATEITVIDNRNILFSVQNTAGSFGTVDSLNLWVIDYMIKSAAGDYLGTMINFED